MAFWKRAEPAPRQPAPHPKVLLHNFRELASEVPDFGTDAAGRVAAARWLGRAVELVRVADKNAADSIAHHAFRAGDTNAHVRQWAVNGAVLTFHSVLAKLELQVSADPSGSEMFGPGAVYDFARALRSVVQGAESTVLLIDPYLDQGIFDLLGDLFKNVHTKLLCRQMAAGALVQLAGSFVTQHGTKVEIRSSADLHDRVIAVDARTCWVAGQSFKDAAKSKATYLAPLEPAVSLEKIRHYDNVWTLSTVVFP